MGHSPTIRMDQGPDRVPALGLVVPEDPAAPDLVALPPVAPEVPAVLDPVRLVALTDPAALVVPVLRADLHLVDRAELDLVAPVVPVEPDPADLVVRPDLMVVPPVAPAALEARVDLDLVVLVVPVSTDRADRAVRAVLVVLVVLVDLDLVVPAVLVDLVDLVDLVAPDLMDPVGRVVPVDRRRRHMCSMARSIAVARNSAVRGTRRTASAHPTTVLRHRPRSVGSAGTTDLLRGIRRRTGMGRLLPVAGTVRRLPVVGTRRGTDPAAT